MTKISSQQYCTRTTQRTINGQMPKIRKPFKGKRNVHPLTILNINTILKVGISKVSVRRVHVCVLHALSHTGGNNNISCRWSHLSTCDTFSSKIKRQVLFSFSSFLPIKIFLPSVPCTYNTRLHPV